MHANPSSPPLAGHNTTEQPPNCWQCRFFRITHLRATPYGCNLMGFQSAVLPNIEVLRADGAPCHGFMSKPPAAQAPAR